MEWWKTGGLIFAYIFLVCSAYLQVGDRQAFFQQCLRRARQFDSNIPLIQIKQID